MKLSKEDISILCTAARIHDFGNIAVRSSVLLKEGPLTDDERKHVQTHTLVASMILEPIGTFETIIPAIKHHHEHYDGSGYPDNISGNTIPIMSRIIFLAESYDAMTTPRPYRSQLSAAEARTEIAGMIGTHYDPMVVQAFLETA